MTEKIISTGCPHDCGGKCVLRVHVRDDRPVKITTVDNPELKACARGLSYLERFNSPDRLQYPMKRVGERGEGKFKRISWNEALDTVAGEMSRVKAACGNSAFLLYCWSGDTGHLYETYAGSPTRLFNMFGGCVQIWSTTSFEGLMFASQYTFGDVPKAKVGFPADSNEFDDLVNSRLILLWGCNPAESVFSTATRYYLNQAKEKGIEIITIDPRYTESAAAWASEWIPILPGTDTAMLAAMAYVMITEKLHDQAYLDKYTTGFGIFRDYILGTKDGIPKTPQWAEKITAVPASTIEKLARTYATTKPAAFIHGWAAGRTAFGEQFHRMAITLEAMTGNIGIHGGSAGNAAGYPMRMGLISTGQNPLKAFIKTDKWADCVLLGKSGGYPGDIKMMYVAGANPLNQIQNANKGAEALSKVGFLVVNEQVMTSTAKFADILLPVTMHFERNDIYTSYLKGYYAIYGNKVAEPRYECKSDLEIFTGLANRLGISGFNPKTEEEWLKSFVAASEITDYDEFKKRGYHIFPHNEPRVAFKEYIRDPEHNPFPTPSGKIEIYSETLARMDFKNSKYGSYIPPFPQYIPEEIEGNKYPLRLITPHFKYRAHSSFYDAKSLRKRYTHEVWINTKDAQERGIKHGDTVKVSSEVGTILIKAKVTGRIIRGAVCVYEGTPYQPDKDGVDRGGCANTLAKDDPSPAGAFPYNSGHVQVQKL